MPKQFSSPSLAIKGRELNKKGREVTIEQKIDITLLCMRTAVKGWIIIYGLIIITNYMINIWTKAAPIWQWTIADVQSWY